MVDLIFICGAPGSGKTTIAKLLKKKLRSPYLDLDWLRQFHLDEKWKGETRKEEAMSFENLTFILKNYSKHGYKNVITTGLDGSKIRKILRSLKKTNHLIVSLVITDPKVLKKRVLTETRDSGWRNFKKSIYWNSVLQKGKLMKDEFRLDNTRLNPVEAVEKIQTLLKSKKRK